MNRNDTGGEPFLLPDIDRVVQACAQALPTTLLTNGMLLHGRRLDRLRSMPRDRLTPQISIDSATPARHDAHRGIGTWARAVAGVRTAQAEGFTVKVAATLTTADPRELTDLRGFLDDLGVDRAHQLIRPLAHRGAAESGLQLTVETLLPEVTITADGVYWHPVGADDTDQFVRTDILPLADAITEVQARFRAHRLAADSAARAFPCA